jgi:hypothetical protein
MAAEGRRGEIAYAQEPLRTQGESVSDVAIALESTVTDRREPALFC